MTSSRYIIARVAQAFGYVRKTHRMTEASSEMHLLREAETYLGMSVWERVESINELSMEYWNLRKLVKERDEVTKKEDECKQRLDKAHEERATLLNASPEQNEELARVRAEHLVHMGNLARERDALVAEARDVRRIYMGTKTKMEVLTEERGGKTKRVEDLNQIEDLNARLAEIRQRFDELKGRRAEIGERIAAGDRKLDEVDEKIAELRQIRREKAAEAFQVIGEMNKELSRLRAETGLLEVRMRQLYSDIGRHISLNATTHAQCAAVAKNEQGLVAIMKALRRSISYNHKLAGVT